MSGGLILVVAAALYDEQGQILLAQRPAGKAMAGLWEFPGGKIEPGESPEAALIRELREEIGISVKAEHLRPITFASHRYESFHLLMPLFACREWFGDLEGKEGQNLAWVSPENLLDYPAPAADIPLFVELAKLREQKSGF